MEKSPAAGWKVFTSVPRKKEPSCCSWARLPGSSCCRQRFAAAFWVYTVRHALRGPSECARQCEPLTALWPRKTDFECTAKAQTCGRRLRDDSLPVLRGRARPLHGLQRRKDIRTRHSPRACRLFQSSDSPCSAGGLAARPLLSMPVYFNFGGALLKRTEATRLCACSGRVAANSSTQANPWSLLACSEVVSKGSSVFPFTTDVHPSLRYNILTLSCQRT